MRIEGGLQRVMITGLLAALLATPARACGRQPAPQGNAAGYFTELSQEPDRFQPQQSEGDRLEAEQEARESEQDRKEREQEKKEQAQEKLEHMQELYDDAREDLDD